MPAAVATRTIEFPTARVYAPFLQPSRYKGAHGGRGSAKSHEFAKNLLKRCIEKPGTRAVCVREVQRTLAQSVKKLLEDKIKLYKLENEFQVSQTQIVTPGDGVIIFQGMQDHTADSIKSLEGFHIAWVEEAQTVSERSLTLLRPTIREPNSELWFTWNPRRKSDPIDKLLRGPDKPEDAIVIGSTYRDNPWFPDVLRVEMEWDKKRDPEKYAHVWLGDYERKSEARVFKNWVVEDFDTLVDAPWLLGGDWGFSVDPTVLFRGWVSGRDFYICDEVYRIGCEIDHTPALWDSLGCTKNHNHEYEYLSNDLPVPAGGECDRFARPWIITADSARPETISYMQRNGYPRVQPAIKGAGSVEEGVTFLQNYDIHVHSRCVHAIDELTMYSYKTHPQTEEIMPVLDDRKNHVIDSLRYAVETLRGEQPGFASW